MPAKPLPPFLPQGTRPALFFLHIPKTSGSAQNRALRSAYGRENSVLHAEGQLEAIAAGKKAPMARDCVSAHLSLSKWRTLGCSGYAMMTVLRDPWARLVSHLNWMDRFNHGVDAETLPRLPDGYREVVRILKTTDFDDAAGIGRMRDALAQGDGARLFDNLQCRMLAPEDPGRGAPVTQAHAQGAVAALSDFDIVGLAEDQPRLSRDLGRWLGSRLPAPAADPVNPARTQRLKPENTAARAALIGWIQHDETLVDAARHAALPRWHPRRWRAH